ncbi:MAG: hypothetical protein V3T31_06425 [candidate division Zixibacteria bacterium]
MVQNSITVLEREIASVLKEEYSFYQKLYVLLDKQRDSLKFGREENLLDMFAEIERCKRRIDQSEQRVRALKERDPRMFRVAAVSPEVKRLVNSIVTLVKKNASLVHDNEAVLKNRHERIKQELSELKNSRKILQYIREEKPSPQFVDGKE